MSRVRFAHEKTRIFRSLPTPSSRSDPMLSSRTPIPSSRTPIRDHLLRPAGLLAQAFTGCFCPKLSTLPTPPLLYPCMLLRRSRSRRPNSFVELNDIDLQNGLTSGIVVSCCMSDTVIFMWFSETTFWLKRARFDTPHA